jgi:hypothetical protein
MNQWHLQCVGVACVHASLSPAMLCMRFDLRLSVTEYTGRLTSAGLVGIFQLSLSSES